MMAAVLTLLWRDVAGVRELTRLLARDSFLWCNPTKVSQQAVSQRFLTFPNQLFEKVFKDLLPIRIEKLPEGVYLATSDALPGLVAQGETLNETLEIARDVAVRLIAGIRKDNF